MSHENVWTQHENGLTPLEKILLSHEKKNAYQVDQCYMKKN